MTKIETKPLDAEELVKSKLQELIDFRKENNDIKEFWGKQFDLGLAWVQFPEGAGGLGLNPKYQLMVIETLRNEGISQQNRVANILGIGMGAPTIIEYRPISGWTCPGVNVSSILLDKTALKGDAIRLATIIKQSCCAS